MNWQVTYWTGSNLASCFICATDIYSLAQAIGSSPAAGYSYSIIKIERVPS